MYSFVSIYLVVCQRSTIWMFGHRGSECVYFRSTWARGKSSGRWDGGDLHLHSLALGEATIVYCKPTTVHNVILDIDFS
jgi:hypothetical protein